MVTNQGRFFYDLHGQGTNSTTGLTNEVGSQVGSGTTSFYAVTPCRVLDTRNPDGEYGGPALAAGAPRAFTVHGTCGIPAAAKAISVNITVVGATTAGSVSLYAAGISRPMTSTINYATGQVRANNAVVTVNAGNGKMAGYAGQASGTVHIIVDVNGYFQ